MRRRLISPRLRFRSADPGAATPGTVTAAPVADATADPGAPTTPSPTQEAPPAAQQQAPAAQPGDGLPDDPAVLKSLIVDLRRENAASRTNAKTQAAEEARNALAQDIGKALGLVQDENATPKPEELTAQVQAAQAAARESAVQLAVYRTASTHQGDPNALLDSRAFLAKVTDLDPAAADFQAQVDAAVKAAVADNPKLKAAPVATASSVDHAGGTGDSTRRTPKSLTDAVATRLGTS